MPIIAEKYIKYVKNKKTLFYYKDNSKTERTYFKISNFDKSKWQVSHNEDWHYMLFKKSNLPNQGWKIHVSANIEDAQSVLLEVSRFLVNKKVSFKFVPSLYDLSITYSKSNDRIEAGKFITIYPRNDDEFCELLDPLVKITSQYKEGPYILNDRPWRQSNVYFRYGAFTKLTKLQNGIPVYAIETPDGSYIEDKRQPYYSKPDFVSEPGFVTKNNTFPKEKEFSEISELGIKDAIHFSTSGGIYDGQYKNQAVIIKEGRPNIGLSGDYRDGFIRILDEYKVLNKLKDIDGVVTPLDYKKIWKHNYLIEEKIDGITLGDYLSTRFPFANQLTDKIKIYRKDSMAIIDSLIHIIEQVHNRGIAFVDFQPENILVNTNGDTKVTLIDFESAKSVNEKYEPDLVIPEYASFQSKTCGDADWVALYRIARTIFLPIEPTVIYNKQLENRQNENIKTKFGQEAVDYLAKVRKICETHTTVDRQASFYDGKLKLPSTSISRGHIINNINSLVKGIVHNIDYNTDELIHGDVNQFDDKLSKYTINYGAMGVIMTLFRVAPNELDKDKLSTWVRRITKNILSILNNDPDYNIGLFNGLSGIALSLYELGHKKIAEKLFSYCNTTKRQLDISIYSGLAGIGLGNLSLYAMTKKKNYKNNTISIAQEIIERYDNGELHSQTDYEGKFSLIKGWSGVTFFLWKASILLDIPHFKEKAVLILDEIIDKAIVDSERGLSLLDKNKRIDRLLPYLDTGFAGFSLLLIDMLIDDYNLINDKYNYLFKSIKNDAGSFCAYCCCLFSGVSGLIVSANAIYQYFSQDSYLDNYINSLNNYAISITGDEILMPGLLGVKCSMDYETGTSGILLALADCNLNNGNWNAWFPLPQNNELNLFNNKPSQKLSW